MEPLRGDDPRQIGRYKLVARLGAGGMGQVFLGFSPSGRPMAVKVVHRDLARDQAFLHRFRQEVAAARKVSGAYTAPVVDAGYGDLPWLATVWPLPYGRISIRVSGPQTLSSSSRSARAMPIQRSIVSATTNFGLRICLQTLRCNEGAMLPSRM